MTGDELKGIQLDTRECEWCGQEVCDDKADCDKELAEYRGKKGAASEELVLTLVVVPEGYTAVICRDDEHAEQVRRDHQAMVALRSIDKNSLLGVEMRMCDQFEASVIIGKGKSAKVRSFLADNPADALLEAFAAATTTEGVLPLDVHIGASPEAIAEVLDADFPDTETETDE